MNKQLNNPSIRTDRFSVRSWRPIQYHHNVEIGGGGSTGRKYASRQKGVSAPVESLFYYTSSRIDRLNVFHLIIMFVVDCPTGAIWLRTDSRRRRLDGEAKMTIKLCLLDSLLG